MKKVILSADDYGLYDEVCDAIVELIHKKRISATGCMVNMPNWQKRASSLAACKDKADIGLHLNLTEGVPLTDASSLKHTSGQFKSLKKFIVACYLRGFNKTELKLEIKAQIESFYETMGFWPVFIDGHQHVQQLPVVRQALIDAYQELKLSAHGCYMRVSTNMLSNNESAKPYAFKTWLIYRLGGRQWQRLLMANNIAHNIYFAGVYDFSQQYSYRDLFNRYIAKCASGTLVMCHPSVALNANSGDPIAAARLREYQYLSSDAFIEDCNRNDVMIERFRFK